MSDVNEKWIETERFIVKGLLENDSYFRRVITNLKKEYFSEKSGTIIKVIDKYYKKYNKIPPYTVVKKAIQKSSLNEKQQKTISSFVDDCENKSFNSVKNEEWLFDETKDYVKEKSMFNFISECADSMYKDDMKDYEGLHKKMGDIVSVNWEEDLGVFYSDLMEFDAIYDTLEDMNNRIPLGIPKLDNAIGGGIINKSLTVIAGSAGTGKTMIMGNIACNAIKAGKNVVYISFEITKEHIHQRFTATFTDLKVENLVAMRDEVKGRIKEEYEKGKVGEFVIAEFPPSSITAMQLDTYLTQLKIKKDFSPDLIIVDYLGIMKPMSGGQNLSSYDKGKEVSENLRWLGYKHSCPVVTGTQNNRSSVGEMDVGMDALSDSFGIGMTADLIITITKPDTLDENNQLRFKITKSRLCKEGQFVILDVDYDKMKLDCENGGFESKEEEEMQDRMNDIKERKKKKRETKDDAKETDEIVDNNGIIL